MDPCAHTLTADAEAERLAVLGRYGILGTPPEATFTRLAQLAQRSLGTSGALISFLGERRTHFKARVGITLPSYPRAQALCTCAALSERGYVIPDMAAEPQLAASAFVQQNRIGAYAGVPLKTDSGTVLGALAVTDTAPRPFGDGDLALLHGFAGVVLEHLETRRRLREQSQQLSDYAEQDRSRAHLGDLLEVVPYYAFTARADGNLIYANRTLLSALGLSALPERLSDLYPAAERRRLEAAFAQTLAGGEVRLEAQLSGPNAQSIPVVQRFFVHARVGGNEPVVSVLARDRSAQLQRDHLERQRAEALELTARGAPLPAVLLQLSHFLEQHCPGTQAAVSLLSEGRLEVEVAPTLPSTLTRILDGLPIGPVAGASGVAAATGKAVVSTDIRRDEIWRNLRYYALQQGIQACWAEPIMSDQGSVLGTFALYVRDKRQPNDFELRTLREAAQLAAIAVSRQQLYRQLEREAHYDALTGLPNRRLLHDYLGRALEQAERSGRELGVLLLDLNDFKKVNDSLGHSAGDTLLCEVALRLRGCSPQTASVARSSGDEFVFVAPLDHRDDAAKLAFDITAALQTPFVLQGRTFRISASIGVSLYPEDARDAETLLKAADSAMYAAKAEGKAGSSQGFRRYLPEMTAELEAQLELEGELRRALLNDELRLYVQPRFELTRARFVAYEALVRWQHPVRGLLAPDAFLAVAEKAGLLPQLDGWVLHQVALTLAAWNAEGRFERLSCNVSATSFQSDTFFGELSQSLSTYTVAAERLELEITENLLMQDLHGAAAQLHKLKQTFPGVRVAIDDFGSGYSSLAYLRQLPVDTLKIDRAFTRDLDHDDTKLQRTALAVIRTIVALGRDLGFRIVAEGAETDGQLRMLTALGVDEVQGYVLGKPQPLSEALLERPDDVLGARDPF